MAFQIRPIVTQVGMARPDVAAAMIVFCVQEAVRETCRRSHLAQTTQSYAMTLATNSIPVALPADKSFLRVMRALWLGASMTDYRKLEEDTFNEALNGRLWVGSGGVYLFSQEAGNVLIYKTPLENGTLRIASSYVPITEFDTAPLPEQAVQSVVDKATALAMAIPGPNQSLQMAMTKEHEFNRRIGGLRSLAFIGEGGSPSFQVQALA